MKLALRHWPDPPRRGRPALLLIHGVTASSRTWWRVGPAVADVGWQVVAVDLRCHGASPCSDFEDRRALAGDVYETLLAELADGRIDVAWGHSLGARTVLQLLNDHPDLARRIVLEDPPGYLTPARRAVVDNWRRETELARHDPAAVAAEQRTATGWAERDIAENVKSLADCRIDPIIAGFERGAREAAPDLAAGVRVPALLIVAEEARGTALPDLDRTRTIRALPPGSRLVELAAGHTIHRDLPEQYLDTVLGWLGSPRG